MVRLGIVGAGVFTNRILLPAYALVDQIEVTAIADIDENAAKETASKFDIPNVFANHQALLDSGLVDAVHVAVPPVYSPDISEAIIRSGRHVISEKPVATSIDRARDLASQARQAGIVSAVDHEMRYDPVFGKLRSLIADGYIGEPRLLNAHVVMAVGIDPASPLRFRTWFDTHSLGGGFSQMVMSHVVDLTRYVLGDFELLNEASQMTVEAKPNANDESEMVPCAADDLVALVGKIPSGGLAVLSGGWSLSNGGGMRWDFRGSEGSLVLDRDGTLYGAPHGKALEVLDGPDAPRAIVTSLSSSEEWLPFIVGLANDFVGAIDGQDGPFTFSTFDDGVRVLESVAAIGAKYDEASQ